MHVRYGEMVGKPVRTADGTNLGRIADLIAEREGDTLCVVALLVGPRGLTQRITFKRDALFQLAPPRRIAWSDVARIADAVHLRSSFDPAAHGIAERAS